jgi:hypothetical protein
MSRRIFASVIVLVVVLVVIGLNYSRIIGIMNRPDFEVSASFNLITIHYWQGNGNNTIITLNSINGFEGNITLEIIKSFGHPNGLEETLEPPKVFLPANGKVQASLTLFAKHTIPEGHYYVDIDCEGEGIQHSIRIDIQVN